MEQLYLERVALGAGELGEPPEQLLDRVVDRRHPRPAQREHAAVMRERSLERRAWEPPVRVRVQRVAQVARVRRDLADGTTTPARARDDDDSSRARGTTRERFLLAVAEAAPS